jgi:hypothetical protein
MTASTSSNEDGAVATEVRGRHRAAITQWRIAFGNEFPAVG